MNTLNICLGHLPFPVQDRKYIDLMLVPKPVAANCNFALIPDATFGKHGSSLSEYAQLIWLYRNIEHISAGKEYLHIFQYRRFCATHKDIGTTAVNNPWSTVIQESELPHFESDFVKHKDSELLNTPVRFPYNTVVEYSTVHILEDIQKFGQFLEERNILSPEEIADFFSSEILIPACNIGVFKVSSFIRTFNVLEKAATFIDSDYFIEREGYQRRNMGFLLERLNSYLLCSQVQKGLLPAHFGNNIIISETNVVQKTTSI